MTKRARLYRRRYTTQKRIARGRWLVELVVGNQGFRICTDWPRAEAFWMRSMLGKALANIEP